MPLLSRLAVQAARAYGMLVGGSPNNVPVSYLVVAGGGSGGMTSNSGGGGAGGMLTSTATLSILNTYSIAVGAGGASVSSVNANGNQGNNSSISGTGLSTITAIGGGYGGGSGSKNGGNGGSGGGGGYSSGLGGNGTAGQGNNGGLGGGTAPSYSGGGGGGASQQGGNSTGPVGGGVGGNGLASSISGSSVTYAGGGGASNDTTTSQAGGTGGGGAGGRSGSLNGVAGTANLGGGGGGGWSGGASGAGGSGIVIISYTSATPRFVGGTITTSGGNQIHTFTSSGTLSPITPITASYLVVAGGGGGGASNGASAGGAGAGGLRTSSTTLYSGATYIVTVGAGGAGGAGGANNQGSLGNSSSLAGTGLTTVTSTGGGGGGAGSGGAGQNGGSGGGGGTNGGTGGSGTSGEGFAGGTAETGGSFRGGGGGGASAVGAGGTSGGTGGAGTASSITGSSITYAGGGGGGAFSGASGAGGAGGGGAGGTSSAPNGVSGTPSLGGGGGGSQLGAGGAGGSGIVIISYAGSQAFNGGLVTSSGGNTIHTFTSTGALTPLTNNLTNSLRFRSSASAYLSRTPTVAGNRRTFTYSAWVKIGTISTWKKMLSVWNANTDAGYFDFGINNNNTFTIQGWNTAWRVSTQVFRDPSAWYHIVVAVDTTQATAANRIKLYVNGNQVTAFSSSSDPTQNYDFLLNSTVATYIGTDAGGVGTSNFDGYMTDINFIDGQALEPYYFGNNDANGVWKPIQYRGTYGTNGFYLNFSNTTSTTTLGFDSSPNGNNWTTNNISLTAGTTYDAMTDVPTNTSATVANYAVWNAIAVGIDGTVSSGNLNIAYGTASTRTGTSATIGMSSGKYYWEISTVTQSGSFEPAIGITNSTLNSSTSSGIGFYPGFTANGWGYVASDGNKYNNGTATSYGATWTSSDVMGVAFDADNGTLTFYKNNVSQGTAFTGLTSGPYFPAIGDGSTAGTFTIAVNFGQRPFSYTPPTGFVALNTFNLPTPTILQGNKYMDATLYTGTGTTRVLVNQGQFKPDFVWMKGRSNARNNNLYDSVRGTTKELNSNTTGAETTNATGLTAFNSNGWTIGSDGGINTSSETYVGWQWQAGQGSTSSNTSGSITSTISVNTTAGFSIVTYTGTGANATVGHGLGVKPSMIIVRNRSIVQDWRVWNTNLTSGTGYLSLNLTDAAATATTLWNSLDPTSTVINLGTGNSVNGSGNSHVAYCWAEIAGFSRFGSYTGNGSADGPFIYTGFRPKYVMIKVTSITNVWLIIDSVRNTFNVANLNLNANASSVENTASTGAWLDFTSNGFKIRNGTDGAINTSSNNYIYACFAENPFKNSNAR